MMLPHDDRRESPRILARIHVRPLGEQWRMSECLGDLALGGAGVAFPRLPDAETFELGFSCPGDPQIHRVTADLVDADPMPGTRDRESPFFLRLRFRSLRFETELRLARAIEMVKEHASAPDFDRENQLGLPGLGRCGSFASATAGPAG